MNRALICQKHQQQYQNYCMICMEPLCPNCIDEHYQVHRDTGQFKMDTIKNVQSMCVSKITKLRDLVEVQNKKLDSSHTKFNVAVMFDRVMEIKKSMIAEINKIVESRLRDIEIMENQYRHTEIKRPCHDAAELVNGFLERMDTRNPAMIDTLRFILEFNDNEFIKVFYRQLNENYNKIRNTKCEVVYEEIKYRNLINDCLKILNPYRTPSSRMFDDRSGQQQSSNTENLFIKFTLPEASSNNQQLAGLSKPSEPDLRPLIIENSADYSEDDTLRPANEFMLPIIASKGQRAFLHYFEPNSANIRIVQLDSRKIRTMELAFPFPIPQYHKSIQLPSGSIILTGGKLFDERKSTKAFIYSIDRNKLKEYCEVIPRSSHALCAHGDFLYIMGGFGTATIERSLEKITLGQIPKVALMRPSRFGGFCSAASFRNIIVKFSSEGIQLYSPEQDLWSYVALRGYLYFENCACIQINENQLFVFGGYDEGQRGVRNSFTVFFSSAAKTFEEYNSRTMRICRENKFPLPRGEGFEDNTVQIYKGKVYGLQSLCDDFNECIDSERLLLCFNSKGWEILDIK